MCVECFVCAWVFTYLYVCITCTISDHVWWLCNKLNDVVFLVVVKLERCLISSQAEKDAKRKAKAKELKKLKKAREKKAEVFIPFSISNCTEIAFN